MPRNDATNPQCTTSQQTHKGTKEPTPSIKKQQDQLAEPLRTVYYYYNAPESRVTESHIIQDFNFKNIQFNSHWSWSRHSHLVSSHAVSNCHDTDTDTIYLLPGLASANFDPNNSTPLRANDPTQQELRPLHPHQCCAAACC